MPGTAALAVVVVTYNSAEHLAALARTLLPQLRDDDELVIVDNASHDNTVVQARSLDRRVKVLAQERNLGFCAGCNVGAAATRAPLILLLNPDSQPHHDCMAQLRDTAVAHPEWAAWQAALMLPDGRINSSGGVVHFLGIGWAGDCERAGSTLPQEGHEIAFPSGAAMVIRREAWDELQGFDDDYFMYGEDLDLGLRLWLAGRRVGLSQAARVTHSYEFDKGSFKWFALERNRWRTVLSVYPAPLLVLLLPALLAFELGLLLVAARGGWLRSKLAAQAAVIRDLPRTLARRRRVQRLRRAGSAQLAVRLTSSLDSPYLALAAGPTLRIPQALYWSLVRGSLALLARGER